VAAVGLIIGFGFVVYLQLRQGSTSFENHRYFLHATLLALVLAFFLRANDIAMINESLKSHKELEVEAIFKDFCEYSGFM
jgi:hypothetical protein